MSACAPCIELRCGSSTSGRDVRTDLYTEQCYTATCPDGSGAVTKCVRMGITLFNASAETIAAQQAILDATALAQATAEANAALDCGTEFESKLQSVDLCSLSGAYVAYGQTGGDATLHPDGTYVENGVVYTTAGAYTAATQEDANALALAAANARAAAYAISGGSPNCCPVGDPQWPATIEDIHNWNDPRNFPAWTGFEPNPPPTIDGGAGAVYDADVNGYGEYDAYICNSSGPYEVTVTVNMTSGTPNGGLLTIQCGGEYNTTGGPNTVDFICDHLGEYSVTRTIQGGVNAFAIVFGGLGCDGTVTLSPTTPP